VRIRDAVAAAGAALTAGGRASARARHRFVCDALHLYRLCPRASCRKSESCRGNPFACYESVRPPEQALDHVATLMLAHSVPEIGLLSRDRTNERLAYEGWVAGVEAGAKARA